MVESIPWRESKLTAFVKETNPAFSLVLCCVNPADTHIQESINTFEYALKLQKVNHTLENE
jgi:hypothetical protein